MSEDIYPYYFVRERGDSIHSNPNCYNIGHRSEPTGLGMRVEAVLGMEDFTISLSGTTGVLGFKRDLTDDERTKLADTIALQKSIEDWPIDEIISSDSSKMSQTLSTQPTEIESEDWLEIGSATWIEERFQDYSEGFFSVSGFRGNRDVIIRLRDSDNNVNLAEISFEESGLNSGSRRIQKPVGTCRLILQAKLSENDASPENNIVYGAIVEWE